MENIYLWTSSHGSKWHKLPKYLRKYIKERKICVRAVPGRKLSMPVVDEIIEAASYRSRKKQCHIIILGM